MKRKKYDDGSNFLMNTAGPRMTNTPGENFGYYSNSNPVKKTTVRQKPAMTAEMQKVARLQQKMKDAGYDIKVDGSWGKETQKAFESYNPAGGSLPSNTRENRFTFNAGDKGKGTDVTAIQDRYVKPMQMPANKNSSIEAAADNTRVASRATPSLQSQRGSSYTGVLPSDNKSNRFTFNAGDRGKGQDITTAQNEALLRNKLVGDGATNKGSTRINYAEGTKKVSGYSKLDMKLGGLLPGGVSRAEYKAAKAAKNAPSTVGPLAGGYGAPSKPTEGIGPLAGGYSKPAPDLSKPVGPMTDIRRYTNADNMPASTPAKKSLKSQYDENKGGYARALKSGKKDAQGNIVDPNTGLSYKQLPTKSGGTGAKKATTAQQKNSLFENGLATKTIKDTKNGYTYYTNGRVLNQKTGQMGKYAHNPKSNKVGFQWDKAKVAPKKKGDDTYMDEVIDIGSRTIGSLGGAALAGGTTFGVGSVAGGIAGDRAGKAFGNWLNKKLGYREENDTSQEGYSLGEAALGGLGGVGGRLVKPVGGALIKFAGKEGVKMAASPLGRAVAATGRAAGKLVGRGGSKATAQAGGQAASQGASKAAAQTAGKAVNAPGAMSKVVPTRQSSLAVGNTGKIPTKAVRGERGRFTRNPSRQPAQTSPQVAPNNIRASFKKGTNPTPASAQTANAATPAAQAASNTAAQTTKNTFKASVSKTKAAARLARQKSKKLITYANNNKKKVAVGAVGAGSLAGGGYAASQIRTSGE